MGYNVGSELGGMHFAVVLRDSKVTNPNLTIMPLKSKKDLLQATHPLELDLGNALYNRLIGKHNALRLSAKEKIKEATQGMERLKSVLSVEKSQELADHIEKEIMLFAKNIDEVGIQAETLDNISHKLSKMKLGSIAVPSQIQTISKMRVLDPKSQTDVLYGIKLPSENLNQIDTCLIKMYTNKKLD